MMAGQSLSGSLSRYSLEVVKQEHLSYMEKITLHE